MNELEKEFKVKIETLEGIKVLFNSNKEAYKKSFQELSINEQAKMLSFIQVNDKNFYEEFNNYIGGISLQGKEKQAMTKEKVVNINSKKEEKTEAELQIEKEAIEMSRKTLISKIKVDKKFHAMTVSYNGFNKKHSRETTHRGFEEMINEKYLLIQSLKYAVMEILQFPEDWEDDIVVTGISLNYDPENGNALRGMVVTMQKDVENLNCPLNINTPFIKFSNYIDDYVPYPVEESAWDYDISKKIKEIINNTYLYMCGETKTVQQKLAV